jgi:hypothetical protein
VARFVQTGDLEEDPESDPSGARYVTVDSVDALLAARTRPKPPIVGTEVLSVASVTRLTGMTPRHISELTQTRVLERRDVGRRLHITTDSLRRWAIGYRPDLIGAIEAVLLAPASIDARPESSDGEPAGTCPHAAEGARTRLPT